MKSNNTTRIVRMQVVLASIFLLISDGVAPLLKAETSKGQTTDYEINVREHGAKGDGTSDDTEAIRAAVKAAATFYSESSSIGTYIQTGPVLIFPPGRYVISDEIVVDVCLEIEGSGRPVIIQKDKDKNIFVNNYAWRQSIRNITFEGGKNQIDMKNPNLDSGQLIIEHCRFYGAHGFAIRNNVISTTIKITDCVFLRCRQIWCNLNSDMSVMRDCWLWPREGMEDFAAIEHHSGMMTMENICGVPSSGSAKRRWIDNHAEWLTARRFRFGGESAGMTPVYNYRKYTPTIIDRGRINDLGVNIILDDCFIVDNGTEKKCAVYCLEVPNLLRITNSTLCTGIEAVRIDDKIKLSNYFDTISPTVLSFSVEGTIGSNVRLPKGLKPVN